MFGKSSDARDTDCQASDRQVLSRTYHQKGEAIRPPISSLLKYAIVLQVLTVNQVFDILLHWIEKRDWERAFRLVIPKRKMKNRKGGTTAQQDENADGDNDDDADDADDALIEEQLDNMENVHETPDTVDVEANLSSVL